MIRVIHHRLSLFKRTNYFAIKTALLTFLYMCIVGPIYILTHLDFLVSFILLGFLLGIFINSIVILVVLIQFINRLNRIVETLFTLYMLLLNIPIAFLLLLLYNYSNHHIYL